MALGAFAFEPQRSPMLTKALGCGRIDSLSEIDGPGILLRANRRQYPLGSKWGFVQPDTDCVVDGVSDGRDSGSQRSFAALFRAERTFRIDALDNDWLDFGRFHRRRAAILKQSGIHQ